MGNTTVGDARRRSEQKKEEAKKRQEAYNQLTLRQKFDRALERGHPESKEVKKLEAKIAAKLEG